jgi:hypothetical protein
VGLGVRDLRDREILIASPVESKSVISPRRRRPSDVPASTAASSVTSSRPTVPASTAAVSSPPFDAC